MEIDGLVGFTIMRLTHVKQVGESSRAIICISTSLGLAGVGMDGWMGKSGETRT